MEIKEYQIRLIIFCSVVGLIFLLEKIYKRRENSILKRRFQNLLLLSSNTILVRAIFGSAAAGVAYYASLKQMGLFNLITIDQGLKDLISIIMLDFLIYFQHFLSHKIPLFWRLHSLHHADPDYDFTTALRFHPIEIILSLFYKSFFILLLGISVQAIILFEAILNSMAIFNHGNFKIPLKLDALIRKLIVTPDMHRVHHSIIYREKHSNYGFNLSIWDRIFKTYVANPSKGHLNMTIGLNKNSKSDPQNLWAYLLWPFKRKNFR